MLMKMIDLDKIESLTILYNPKEDKFGVKRSGYDLRSKERPYPIIHFICPFYEDVMKEEWDHLDPLTDKTGWMKPSYVGWEVTTPNLFNRYLKINRFVQVMDTIYDADWCISARCTNSRCDGYDTEIDEYFMIDEVDVFEKLREIFK